MRLLSMAGNIMCFLAHTKIMITLFEKNYIKLYHVCARKRLRLNEMHCNRHRRRKCGHCDQELSYTAFRSHKSLYYDKSTKKWIRSSSSPVSPEAEAIDLHQSDEGLMDTIEVQVESSISPAAIISSGSYYT